MSAKTQVQYDKILDFLNDGEWHNVADIVVVLDVVLDVRETRIKELLRSLVQLELLEDNGTTKGRKYRKR